MLGARLGAYEVVELIGSGGMGSVYRAVRVDEAFHKEVAIKVVRRGLDLDRVVRQFRRERQITASLEHPNIASLIDGGTTSEGLPYFVMEFIRGKPIDALLRRDGAEYARAGWNCSRPSAAPCSSRTSAAWSIATSSPAIFW